MKGWTEMDSRGGLLGGRAYPPHKAMPIRIAPAERPDAVLAILALDGSVMYWPSSDVGRFEVSIDGWGFFGLGASGVAAASLAAHVDRFLAPWDLIIAAPDGEYLALHSCGGGAPTDALLAEVQARVDLATR